jgi:hypothetical protein
LSSSAVEQHGGRLLRRALDALERESPWHARALGRSLQGLDLEVELDGERIALRSDGVRASAVTAEGPGRAGAVRASVGLAVALDLIEGRSTVLGALRSGALAVRGPARAVLSGGRCADVFLHGMVRCPSSRALLRELRSVTRTGAREVSA